MSSHVAIRQRSFLVVRFVRVGGNHYTSTQLAVNLDDDFERFAFQCRFVYLRPGAFNYRLLVT